MAQAHGQGGSKTPQVPPTSTKAAPKVNKDGSVRKPPVRRDRPALDLASMKVVEVTNADTMRAFRRTRGERDKEQVIVDNLVRKAHEKWIGLGRPNDWNDSLSGYQISVPDAQFETVEWRIRRAGEYFDVAIRFGEVKHQDGYAVFIFIAKDRPVKEDVSNDSAEAKSE
jgi:hypothetical protein